MPAVQRRNKRNKTIVINYNPNAALLEKNKNLTSVKPNKAHQNAETNALEKPMYDTNPYDTGNLKKSKNLLKDDSVTNVKNSMQSEPDQMIDENEHEILVTIKEPVHTAQNIPTGDIPSSSIENERKDNNPMYLPHNTVAISPIISEKPNKNPNKVQFSDYLNVKYIDTEYVKPADYSPAYHAEDVLLRKQREEIFDELEQKNMLKRYDYEQSKVFNIEDMKSHGIDKKPENNDFQARYDYYSFIYALYASSDNEFLLAGYSDDEAYRLVSQEKQKMISHKKILGNLDKNTSSRDALNTHETTVLYTSTKDSIEPGCPCSFEDKHKNNVATPPDMMNHIYKSNACLLNQDADRKAMDSVLKQEEMTKTSPLESLIERETTDNLEYCTQKNSPGAYTSHSEELPVKEHPVLENAYNEEDSVVDCSVCPNNTVQIDLQNETLLSAGNAGRVKDTDLPCHNEENLIVAADDFGSTSMDDDIDAFNKPMFDAFGNELSLASRIPIILRQRAKSPYFIETEREANETFYNFMMKREVSYFQRMCADLNKRSDEYHKKQREERFLQINDNEDSDTKSDKHQEMFVSRLSYKLILDSSQNNIEIYKKLKNDLKVLCEKNNSKEAMLELLNKKTLNTENDVITELDSSLVDLYSSDMCMEQSSDFYTSLGLSFGMGIVHLVDDIKYELQTQGGTRICETFRKFVIARLIYRGCYIDGEILNRHIYGDTNKENIDLGGFLFRPEDETADAPLETQEWDTFFQMPENNVDEIELSLIESEISNEGIMFTEDIEMIMDAVDSGKLLIKRDEHGKVYLEEPGKWCDSHCIAEHFSNEEKLSSECDIPGNKDKNKANPIDKAVEQSKTPDSNEIQQNAKAEMYEATISEKAGDVSTNKLEPREAAFKMENCIKRDRFNKTVLNVERKPLYGINLFRAEPKIGGLPLSKKASEKSLVLNRNQESKINANRSRRDSIFFLWILRLLHLPLYFSKAVFKLLGYSSFAMVFCKVLLFICVTPLVLSCVILALLFLACKMIRKFAMSALYNTRHKNYKCA
ncbi:hypothetical protein ENBRE01_2537 [Enteropsectra breve]|nr:hypothetical protein ENBRE01_2537 [Enteropsectra breve]